MGDLNKKLYFRKTKKFFFLLFPYITKIYMCDSDSVIKMESMKCPLPIAPIVLLGPSKPHSRNFFLGSETTLHDLREFAAVILFKFK